jgi:hypothetical protein
MQCVGAEIDDLEYTPKPEFEGHFKVTNTRTEVRHSSLIITIYCFLIGPLNESFMAEIAVC